MESGFGWIRFDDKEYEVAAEARALLTTPGSRDELGLGGIRDRYANAMFPGTSTIQTRLRYAMFVAWTYDRLKHLPTAELVEQGRAAEIEMIARLVHGEAGNGIIGVVAEGDLVRLPSMTYWTLLQQWRGADVADDELPSRATWIRMSPPKRQQHPLLLRGAPSIRLTKKMTFELGADEIAYLTRCLREREVAGPKSLFHEILNGAADAKTVDGPLDDIKADSARNRTILHNARAFSNLMWGASLTYNILLLRRRLSRTSPAFLEALQTENVAPSTDDEEYLVARQKDWNDWKDGQRAEHARLVGEPSFFQEPDCTGETHAIRFALAWAERATTVDDPSEVEAMIVERERCLKGLAQRRFGSDRALARWGGASDVNPASYRWHTARTFLQDMKAKGLPALAEGTAA